MKGVAYGKGEGEGATASEEVGRYGGAPSGVDGNRCLLRSVHGVIELSVLIRDIRRERLAKK